MKKCLLALLMMISMYLPIHAQNNSTNNTKYLSVLQDKLKQIVNRTIFYNYYLGEDLFSERSFINDARVSINSNNQIELYLNLTTQKYDLNSSAITRSEHGESIVFDPASINEIKIKGKLSDYSKSELGLLVIDFNKEVEKRNYFKRSKNEDPTLLEAPSVYEFELPYFKNDISNPASIKNALLDLKSLNK